MNTRVFISFLLLVLMPFTSFSEEKFDKIRCNGKLIEPGDSLQFVLENWGSFPFKGAALIIRRAP